MCLTLLTYKWGDLFKCGMVTTMYLDNDTCYLIEENDQEHLISLSEVSYIFLTVGIYRIICKKSDLSQFVTLKHSRNSMHYYEKLLCNVLDSKFTISLEPFKVSN